MKFGNLSFGALALFTSFHSAVAVPNLEDGNAAADAMTSEYEIIDVVQVGGINLTMYGYPEGTADVMPRELTKRCGDNVGFCRPNRGVDGRADICMDLINSFRDPKFSNTVIAGGLKATCHNLGVRKGKCCVSFTQNLRGTGATYSDLFPAAFKLYNQCQKGGLVAGLTDSVNLGGICGTQCLSSSSVCPV